MIDDRKNSNSESKFIEDINTVADFIIDSLGSEFNKIIQKTDFDKGSEVIIKRFNDLKESDVYYKGVPNKNSNFHLGIRNPELNDGKLTNESLAEFFVDALIEANLIQPEHFQQAVEIAIEEITAVRAMNDY